MNATVKKYIADEFCKSLNEALDKAGVPPVIAEYSKRTKWHNDHYAWFEESENKGDKKVKIYCAACQSTYMDYKPKHNTQEDCPECGHTVLMRQSGGQNQVHKNNEDFVCYFQKIGDVIIARFFDNTRYYTDTRFSGNSFDPAEYQRFIFSKDFIRSYSDYSYGKFFGRIGANEWTRTTSIRVNIRKYHVLNFEDDLRALLDGTHLTDAARAWFEYSGSKIEGMYWKRPGCIDVLDLYKFAKWPVLEYLQKLGYSTLVDEIVNGRKIDDLTLNLYKKKANAVLGVPHDILKKYNHPALRERDIKAIKQLIEYKRLGQLTPERFKFISSVLTDRSLDPLGIFRNFGLEKVLNYINRQAESRDAWAQAEHKKQCRKRKQTMCGCGYNQPFYSKVTPATTWRDFQDYRIECHYLGLDLSDEGVMFPRDLYVAHERTSAQSRAKREEERRIEAARQAEEYEIEAAKRKEREKAEFERKIKRYLKKSNSNGAFIFGVVASADELSNEGKALRHCVGGYDSRIIAGTCVIFYIRSCSAPEKPLFTLEYNPLTYKIIQIRGFSNKEAPQEVWTFAEESIQRFMPHVPPVALRVSV